MKTSEQSKNVRINIRSVISSPGEEDQRIEFSGEGVMTYKNGTVCIRFLENLTDSESDTCISFEESDPGLISLSRKGDVVSSCSFSAESRHSCNYEIGGMINFELCINTHKTENTVTFGRGGTILLEYSIEMRGTELQSAVYRLKVTCI